MGDLVPFPRCLSSTRLFVAAPDTQHWHAHASHRIAPPSNTAFQVQSSHSLPSVSSSRNSSSHLSHAALFGALRIAPEICNYSNVQQNTPVRYVSPWCKFNIHLVVSLDLLSIASVQSIKINGCQQQQWLALPRVPVQRYHYGLCDCYEHEVASGNTWLWTLEMHWLWSH